MTAVTLPPVIAGIDSIRASGAARTAAIAPLLAWACCSCLLGGELRDEQEGDGGGQRHDGRGETRPRPRAAPPAGPLAGHARAGSRPGGGSCLVRGAAASTRARIPGGGGIAAAIASLRGGLPQPADLLRAGGATGQVLLELGPLGLGQRVEGVAAGQQVHFVTLGAHQVTSMQSRSRIRPSLIRVLTVPSATPSSSAT